MPLPPKEAEALWPELSVRVTGNLVSPFAITEPFGGGPTLDLPIDVHGFDRMVVMCPLKFTILNKQTGRAVREIKLVRCQRFTERPFLTNACQGYGTKLVEERPELSGCQESAAAPAW